MHVHTHAYIYMSTHTYVHTHISGPSQETDHISSEQGKFHQASNYKGVREPDPGQKTDLLLVPNALDARRAGHRPHSPPLHSPTKQAAH